MEFRLSPPREMTGVPRASDLEAIQRSLFLTHTFCTKHTMASEATRTASTSGRPIQLSFPLPKAPETRIHIHLTIQATSVLLFLTTTANGDTSTTVPLGSFVYALPDVRGVLSDGCIFYLVLIPL